MQRRTIGRCLTVSGTGLHSGLPASVMLEPSTSGTGISIRFKGGPSQSIETLAIVATDRCTRVETADGRSIDTIEHLMASLAITGITDIALEFDCLEAPILDGSAIEWVLAIESAGLVVIGGPAPILQVRRPFEFSVRGSHYSVEPGPLSFDVSIDFPGTPIGFQAISIPGSSMRSLADSRTFVLEHEIAALRDHGLALGGGLHNAVVIGQEGPINESGFRHVDECVRHKALDLVGDLRLAGGQIIGVIKAHKPGHAATGAFLKAMFAEGVIARPANHIRLAA